MQRSPISHRISNSKIRRVMSLGYNLSSDAAGGDGTTGPGGFLNATGDLRNTNPNLGPLQDNGGPTFTHALLPGSPAIDTGGGCSINASRILIAL
jgi:hypothetical protein